ncbi:hypothetical protein [Phyllobacterium sp. SB3]|uniref:hypothetical protein n=1 Tax=Phyllobacterium sp. SB3 TaxID=3156073 RepID=UPI0032AEFE81
MAARKMYEPQLHVIIDANDRPVSFLMTPGQFTDYTGAAALLGSYPRQHITTDVQQSFSPLSRSPQLELPKCICANQVGEIASREVDKVSIAEGDPTEIWITLRVFPGKLSLWRLMLGAL